MVTGRVSSVLDGHRGSLSLHRRFIMVREDPVVLDHLLSSTGGAFLIQERVDLADVDTVRRTAEALELVVLRPIEPVVVVTAGGGLDLRRSVRGVRVVAEEGFAQWVDDLSATTTKADMVLINARLEKATEDWARHRRIPDWEARARLTDDGIHAKAPEASLRPPNTPGPRSWARGGSARDNRPHRPVRRRRISVPRAFVGLLIVAVILAVLTTVGW